MAKTQIRGAQVVDGGLTDADFASANKDGLPGVYSLRSLGQIAQQACAGNDPRLVGTGTTFPGSPTTGQRYFRTDLGWACYYDGTRWLTEFEFAYNVLTQAFSSSPGQILAGPIRTDYAPYFTRFDLRVYVETTNNSTNYWRIRLQGSNTSWSAQTDIDDRNTSTYSANTHYHISVVPSGSRNPTNKDWLRVLLEKTGSPGLIWTETAVYFRLIVT